MFQEKLACPGDSERLYRDDVQRLLATIEDLRDHQVASGFHRIFGALLDWPAWLFEGTTIAPQQSLPKYIGLADDLIILANLLDHMGPERLLVDMASHPAHNAPPGLQSAFLSAPTLEHALRHAIRITESQLPMLRVALTKSGGDCYSLSVATTMGGLVGQFYAYGTLLMFANIAESQRFRSAADDGPDAAPMRIIGGRSHWHAFLKPYFRLVGFAESEVARVNLAKNWVEAPNPYRDDLIWQEGQWWANTVARNELVRRLDLALRNALYREHRIRPLAEAARGEGLSERTLSRRLADLGTSYQERLDLARSHMAKQLLRDEQRSVASIARTLGFSHSSSFARAFAGWTGLSPRQWRMEQTASVGPHGMGDR